MAAQQTDCDVFLLYGDFRAPCAHESGAKMYEHASGMQGIRFYRDATGAVKRDHDVMWMISENALPILDARRCATDMRWSHQNLVRAYTIARKHVWPTRTD